MRCQRSGPLPKTRKPDILFTLGKTQMFWRRSTRRFDPSAPDYMPVLHNQPVLHLRGHQHGGNRAKPTEFGFLIFFNRDTIILPQKNRWISLPTHRSEVKIELRVESEA